MAGIGSAIALAGSALGTLGGVLVFVEFFLAPSYVSFDTDHQEYTIDIAPSDVREHSWAGRIGALLVSLGFALHFVAGLVG